MIHVKFEGGQELQTALNQLTARVSARIKREALREGAEPLRRAMVALAPFEPGKPDLRDSIVVSNARGTDADEVAIAVGPSRAGFYGSFHEFGTAKMAAKPFMRPAFDQTWQKSLAIIAHDLWASLSARGIRRATVIETAPIESGGGRLL